jgi:exopolysaccharide biosynthesis WecB/TagA/CpsF family protein
VAQFLHELKTLLSDKSQRPRTALFINAHVYNLAVNDPVLRRHLNAARVVTADGMAIVWAAPLFKARLQERCNMTEAFRAFLAAAEMPPSTALLLGCATRDAEAAAGTIERISSHCRIRHAYSGFLTDQEYQKIFQANTDVDFIFLGMGTPRTEQLTQLAVEVCPKAIVWAIGGGTIRIMAGTMTEAPGIWRRFGLQWLHRLASEPGELWRRYLVGNPAFVCRVLKAAFGRMTKTEPTGGPTDLVERE